MWVTTLVTALGMAADLFETYAVTLTAGILLGSLTTVVSGTIGFPLLFGRRFDHRLYITERSLCG